jgi:triosephosphate isomerase
MAVKKPVLFINFKTYEQATGEKALKLAEAAEAIARETKASIVLVAQAVDLRMVAEAVALPVFAQHIDPVGYGSNTGKILAEAVREAGAAGTVLNHAENKQSNEFVEKALERAKSLGLQAMVCAETTKRAVEIASMKTKPDFIAVEPPELIGGDISVSTAKPELITDSVKAVKEISQSIEVVTGAGIKNAGDVSKAIELGTVGVFVASGIVKVENQSQAIAGLARGLKRE